MAVKGAFEAVIAGQMGALGVVIMLGGEAGERLPRKESYS